MHVRCGPRADTFVDGVFKERPSDYVAPHAVLRRKQTKTKTTRLLLKLREFRDLTGLGGFCFMRPPPL